MSIDWQIFGLGAFTMYCALHLYFLVAEQRSFWAGFSVDRQANPVKFWGWVVFDIVCIALALAAASKFAQ